MTQKIFRIHTEASSRKTDQALGEVDRAGFNAYSVIEQTGRWKGQSEYSVCIEIMADADQLDKVTRVCQRIKQLNKQECVLLQVVECQGILVT